MARLTIQIKNSLVIMRWMLWSAIITLTASQLANALTASTIGDCPSLAPRSSPPSNIRDLRPDDIKVIGALGDR